MKDSDPRVNARVAYDKGAEEAARHFGHDRSLPGALAYGAEMRRLRLTHQPHLRSPRLTVEQVRRALRPEPCLLPGEHGHHFDRSTGKPSPMKSYVVERGL